MTAEEKAAKRQDVIDVLDCLQTSSESDDIKSDDFRTFVLAQFDGNDDDEYSASSFVNLCIEEYQGR